MRLLIALLAAALLSSGATAQTCKITGLELVASLPLEGKYQSLSSGDLNGDGLADLVAVRVGEVAVLLSRGRGAFDAPVRYPFGGWRPMLKDLDKDGSPDLALLDEGKIRISHGDRKGGFEFSGSFGLGYVVQFAIGDVDGDGNQDLISRESGAYRVYRGDGTGSFGLPVETSESSDEPGNAGVAAGDLDGDGRDDVVGSAFRYYIDIYLANADATLRHASKISTLYRPLRPTLTDLDGDGNLDALIPFSMTSPVSGFGELLLFEGNGRGYLTGTSGFGACFRDFAGPVVADLDDDGRQELVVGARYGCNLDWSYSLYILGPDRQQGRLAVTPLWQGIQPHVLHSIAAVNLDLGGLLSIVAGPGDYTGFSSLEIYRTVATDCPPPPTPMFEFSPESPVRGQKVFFTNRSVGTPTNWLWDFGDSSSGPDRFEKSPSHAFSSSGVYTVTLSVGNGGGATSTSRKVFVSDPSLIAAFSLTPPNPFAGQTVAFSDQTSGAPTSWSWDFGDGEFSTERNPFHGYARAGTYSVRLLVSDYTHSSVAFRSATVAPVESRLSLLGGRIGVVVSWRSQYTGETGTAKPVPQSDSYGFFGFSSPANPEVFVKALDFGTSSPYLVFFAGLTDYEYTVTFTNLRTGRSVSFLKPEGSFAGGADNRSLEH